MTRRSLVQGSLGVAALSATGSLLAAGTPPHIHFTVAGRGFHELTTQM